MLVKQAVDRADPFVHLVQFRGGLWYEHLCCYSPIIIMIIIFLFISVSVLILCSSTSFLLP